MQAFLKHLANVVTVSQLTWQDFLKVCMRHRNKSWNLKKKKSVYSKIVLPLTLSKGLGVAHDPAKGRYQTED